MDTLPIADVTVNLVIALPRTDTPASITIDPSTFVFQPSQWTTSQVLMATITVSNDDVDSSQDVEDFTVTHSVSTSDATYAAKATDLTVVVRVQDDDTAGIIACVNVDTTCQSVMNLIEGDSTGALFEITKLKSKPLEAVTLIISVDEALTNLITIKPSTLLISVDNWNNINQDIKVTGAIGQYGDLSLLIFPNFKDAQYRNDCKQSNARSSQSQRRLQQ